MAPLVAAVEGPFQDRKEEKHAMQVPLPQSLLLTAAIAPASGSTRVIVRDVESVRSSSWSTLPPGAAGQSTCLDMTAWPTSISITCGCARKLRDPASRPARSRVSVSARDHQIEPAGSLWASAHEVRRVSPKGLQPVQLCRRNSVSQRVMIIVNNSGNWLEAPVRWGCWNRLWSGRTTALEGTGPL